ncbi:extracellular solute-binding protein [Streptomyces sp. DSM 41972]|uniref:Extracellular solute-binding protein n=1 Tax=Streptomyces althioticus subsp. attaecolombicae TaxID=3075534 RepID=A0ABU3I5C9_9ACTN|nr:extracellular solute-binding protein [Streptomyces sp. DSM 41972]SCD65775.1 carbohydrate ABC transporter substrate-binding protein, CUT1 family [Streptomyces sp. di50b]SCD72205.1 carbohydrate ABC transporter substrate-binding protein, CUT1 family [Streptomyces sp. di188]
MRRRTSRLLGGIALVTSLALGATACGGSDDGAGTEPVSAEDIQAALDKGGTVTVWSWEPTLKTVAADFQKKHPKVKINLVSERSGDKHYTALSNAISAGKGVPDVAQLEYFSIGQYSLTEGLTDLSGFGAAKLASKYTPGPWNAVTEGDKVYGLPMDSGPMALFYNKQVFDKYEIAVPTTWDEYLDAARKLHKADPKAYIANDTGDAGFTTSLLWQAGSRPYAVDGANVKIDFGDANVEKFTTVWQKLIDEKLLAPVTSWTDDWYKGLGDGSIASLATGAWMPANFESGVPNASGQWRVAPLPAWAEGDRASAENGGSALTVPALAQNKALAYAFVEYANSGEGIASRVAEGAFPATHAELKSPEFLGKEFPYFGGQKANGIFSDSAANVADDWSYLPFQAYANSIFNDTVGKAYISGTRLADGLKAWQDASVKYGEEQGFTVEK